MSAGRLNDISERDWGYISGIIDGEGYLFVRRYALTRFPNYQTAIPTFGIGMTDEATINKISKLLGVNYHTYKNGHGFVKGIKPMYSINICAHKAAEILPHLNLVTKEKERLALIEICWLLSWIREFNISRRKGLDWFWRHIHNRIEQLIINGNLEKRKNKRNRRN